MMKRLSKTKAGEMHDFKQYLQEDKASMAMKNPNWTNGIMLRTTLARMVANALKKSFAIIYHNSRI